MRISDWSSDVCSSDLALAAVVVGTQREQHRFLDVEMCEQPTEKPAHLRVLKNIVAGRHRRVSREHGFRGDRLARNIEPQAGGDAIADPFQDEERGMAFVDVPRRTEGRWGGQWCVRTR